MAESLDRIQTTLRGLSRREQQILLARAGLGAFVTWAVAWVALAAAVSWGFAAHTSGVWWITALAVAGVPALLWPLRRYTAARDLRRQAVRVEELRPELRGALLTVLDRAERPGGSPVLVARLATRAADETSAVPVDVAHPGNLVRRLALGAFAAFAALLFAGVFFPRGPFEALAALRTPAVVNTAEVPLEAEGPRALVGDITLRYLYPTYTGREPMEVPNSNGEVHAPPGTRVEVRARTAEVYEKATLEVYEEPPTVVEITDGRSLRAGFTVGGAGAWRFLFGDLPSPEYRIVPDPDLAPDVAVQAPQRVQTVSSDDRLLARWTARDDFGIVRVVVEVDEDGKKREVVLREPVDAPRELAAELSLSPEQLGLIPGANAKLRVGAWDNDAISGSKPGWSSVIEIEVLGPKGQRDRRSRYRSRLRDALVLVLADFLVDPSPVGVVGADVSTWATTAVGRYASFDALVQEAWGGARSDTFDDTLLRALAEDRKSLFAFASALGGPGRIGETDLATLVSLQEKHVATTENAVLMLDQVVRSAALARVEELVARVAEEAKELRADFADLSKAAALARLDQLARLYQQLAREAAKLDEGNLREFLNERNEQIQSLMDKIREAIRDGRMEDAKTLMDRLAATMEEMAQQVDDMQSRRQQQNDELQDAMKAMEEELAGLEKDQKELREKTEAARERFGDDMRDAVKTWEEIEKLAGLVVDGLGKLDPTLEPLRSPSWSGGSILDEARADADGLHDSARARDIETALQRADQVYGEIGMLGARVGAAQRRGNGNADGLLLAQRALDAQKVNVQRVRELLEQMANRQARTSPALQRELRQMAEQQQQIADRADKSAGHAEKLSENLPMDAPGLKSGAQRGAEQSERATKAMRDGQPMAAEGGQRSAEEGFREARSSLEEAQRNLRQMQEAASSGGGGKEPKDGEEGGSKQGGEGKHMVPDEIQLPAPEAFKTPEAYRRALLEGMEGDVPEEYKALNRRYYEELVRQ